MKSPELPAATNLGQHQACHKFDPLQDTRWSRFLEKRQDASVFHTTPWLEALRRTYGYEPVVYTTSPPGQELTDGIVLCRVESWLTGRRLVSLPFSDHCEPLVNGHESAQTLFASLREDAQQMGWSYVEIRPREKMEERWERFEPSEAYYHHDLDLTPDLDVIFRSFHKNCVQRKIKRAEHENLVYAEGRSGLLLRQFYKLLLVTRHRHQIPPQPQKWFTNLIDCLGEALKIRVVYSKGIPIAGILTVRHRDKLTYKYGCSDAAYHNLGGMHLLFWKAIEEGKKCGLRTFDFGRSEKSNTGLVNFKDRWGTTRSSLLYCGYSSSKSHAAKIHFSRTSWTMRFARKVFGHVPGQVLSAAGNLFYRHIG